MTELDASRVPRHTGRDVDNAAPTEAEHHMKCPGCGRWFDIRDLREVARDTSFQFIRGRWFQ
jgi:hypothetical protein